MRAQRLVALSLVLERVALEIAERGREAVAAMRERRAAQRAERVLQTLGQGDEALVPDHDFGVARQRLNARRKWQNRCGKAWPAMVAPSAVASVKSDNPC